MVPEHSAAAAGGSIHTLLIRNETYRLRCRAGADTQCTRIQWNSGVIVCDTLHRYA